jgi:acetyltransferase-like isoleucine patch superfamily enzyme
MTSFLSIGDNVFIDDRAYFRRPSLVSIGSNCAFDAGVYITTPAEFGDYIHVGPYVTIIGGASAKFFAEDFSTIAAGARVVCLGEEHLGRGLIGPTIPKEYKDKLVGGQVRVCRFANILTNAIVLPGVTIGEGAVIGANTVMSHDADPWTIYLGSPARKIKKRDSALMIELGEKLKEGSVK